MLSGDAAEAKADSRTEAPISLSKRKHESIADSEDEYADEDPDLSWVEDDPLGLSLMLDANAGETLEVVEPIESIENAEVDAESQEKQGSLQSVERIDEDSEADGGEWKMEDVGNQTLVASNYAKTTSNRPQHEAGITAEGQNVLIKADANADRHDRSDRSSIKAEEQ